MDVLEKSKLVEQYIELDLHHPGEANARLKQYGISVWVLISYLKGTGGDVGQVAEDYAIPKEAVKAAQVYYEQYRAAIDGVIAENAA